MPTLTKARTAQLCTTLRAARARAIALHGSEYSLHGTDLLHTLIERAMCSLVADLGGLDAMAAVHSALGDDITADEVAAERSAHSERQARYLATAAAASTVAQASVKADTSKQSFMKIGRRVGIAS